VGTILLVAIGVVLAAVLYVVVTGVAHGPGTKPIGSAFTAGKVTAGTCAAGSSQTLGAVAITGGCKPGDFVYTLTVEASTVTFGSVLFEVKKSSGVTYAGGSASSSFAILDSGSYVAALSLTGATMAMTSSWQGYGPTTAAPTYEPTTAITNLHTVVIDMGSATSTEGQNLQFVALGIGGYSGSTNPIALP
jgi:hypothetical protein